MTIIVTDFKYLPNALMCYVLVRDVCYKNKCVSGQKRQLSNVVVQLSD